MTPKGRSSVSDDVDAKILALLRGLATTESPLAVHDGDVTDADPATKVISAPLPYLVFYSTPGYGINPRMCGRRGRAVEFTINAVGKTREQAKWAGQTAEDALDHVRITLSGVPRLIRRTEDNPYVRRDDTWIRPDGKPLFVDSRRYTIAAH